MERRDLIVAIAGAILVAAATVGVGFSGVGEGVLAYDIVVTGGREQAFAASLGTLERQSDARIDESIDFDAPQIDSARLTVRAAPTGAFVSGATMHVRLVDPHGTVYEDEAAAPSGGGAFEVALDIPGSARLEPDVIEAASEQEARAQLAQRLPPPTNGTWTLEVQYASGGAVPDASVQMSYVFEFSEWLVDLRPVAGPVK